jgi:CheY-like chemotaxis protein
MRMLIVEDNSIIRQMIVSIVSPLAEAVYECEDGAQALAAYQTHRPDVVLMDIALGVVDGITATRRIRAVDPTAQIIIVTMYDETDLREAAQDAGAVGYVLKENLVKLQQWFADEGVRSTTT